MRRGLLAGLSWLWAVACSSSTQPKLAPCTAASAGQLSLAVAGDTAIDPTQTAGCAVFGPNPSAAARQYLLVPQAVSGVPDDASGFLLLGATVPAAAARLAAAPSGTAPVFSPQQQFDLTLRRGERGPGLRVGPASRPPASAPPAPRGALVGSRRGVQG